MKCHELPTANVKAATYYTFTEATAIANRSRNVGTSLSSVVFIERDGIMEGGLIGIKQYVQIDQSILATRPKIGDQIKISPWIYKISSVAERVNPGFDSFWEIEIKLIKYET